MANVLIIDDDETMSRMLAQLVRRLEHSAEYALTLEGGIGQVVTGRFDVVFLDVNMPDGNGLEALHRIRKMPDPPEVVIITGAGDPDGAEIAIKNGAWDYLQKPLSPKKIVLPLKRVLQYRDNLRATGQPSVILKRESIVGSSAAVQKCLDQLAHASRSGANVLVTGETGTGKELFARALHNNSPRAGRKLIVVDCAALPENLVESMLFGHEKGAFTGADRPFEGLIRQADGGTLFLDEIGELSPSLQKSFLRVLQEKRFRPIGGNREVHSDFRLVAATNRGLEQMVSAGRFRSDLYYRLKAMAIHLPPLRERPKDITELMMHHTTKICSKFGIRAKGFSPDFIEMLCLYHWPGNVRELVNALEHAVSSAQSEPILFPTHLPDHIRIVIARAAVDQDNPKGSRPQPPPSVTIPEQAVPTALPPYKVFRKTVLAEAEKGYFDRLMTLAQGDIRQACRISGLGRTRLYDLLKKNGIERA
ncbi:MAG: sigma-54-dependent Fis family transcriptional regulator [Desulfobacterales bacterium]|nr:sigma-54-dependent Fis family transcriptional regulator [Desulfobacterales bacterium]